MQCTRKTAAGASTDYLFKSTGALCHRFSTHSKSDAVLIAINCCDKKKLREIAPRLLLESKWSVLTLSFQARSMNDAVSLYSSQREASGAHDDDALAWLCLWLAGRLDGQAHLSR
jgi:hypothetical protein